MSDDAAFDAIAAWRPKSINAAPVSLSDHIRSAITPKALVEMWRHHNHAAARHPDVLKSFIKSATDWGRRCASIAEPLLYEIAQQPQLDLDDYTTLAVATCDVNSRRLVTLLLERTHGTRQYVAFYYSLIRCACEFLRPVDMLIATSVSGIMAELGIEMYIPHTRMLIHGFSRLPEPPLKAIENIVDACIKGSQSQGAPLDPSILHELLSIFERTRGRYAKHAQKIIQKLGLENCAKLVSSVYVKPIDHKPTTGKAFTTFYIVDPYAFPIDQIPLPPPLLGNSTKWFILFLYSSVRSMIECNQNFPAGNPFLEQKLKAMQQLIRREPAHVFVFPADVEMQFRAAGRDGIVDDTPNFRYVSFLESFLPQIEDPTQEKPQETVLVFVTQNAKLRAELQERIAHTPCPPIFVQSDFSAKAAAT